jgi:hypothetical protein
MSIADLELLRQGVRLEPNQPTIPQPTSDGEISRSPYRDAQHNRTSQGPASAENGARRARKFTRTAVHCADEIGTIALSPLKIH